MNDNLDFSLKAAFQHLNNALKELDELGILEELSDEIFDAHAVLAHNLPKGE